MPWPTAGRLSWLKGGGGKAFNGVGSDQVVPYHQRLSIEEKIEPITDFIGRREGQNVGRRFQHQIDEISCTVPNDRVEIDVARKEGSSGRPSRSTVNGTTHFEASILIRC